MGCEKCWGDAYTRTFIEPMKSQAEHYRDLIKERKDNPCSEKDQAGQFWDEKRQVNTLFERIKNK